MGKEEKRMREEDVPNGMKSIVNSLFRSFRNRNGELTIGWKREKSSVAPYSLVYFSTLLFSSSFCSSSERNGSTKR